MLMPLSFDYIRFVHVHDLTVDLLTSKSNHFTFVTKWIKTVNLMNSHEV